MMLKEGGEYFLDIPVFYMKMRNKKIEEKDYLYSKKKKENWATMIAQKTFHFRFYNINDCEKLSKNWLFTKYLNDEKRYISNTVISLRVNPLYSSQFLR